MQLDIVHSAFLCADIVHSLGWYSSRCALTAKPHFRLNRLASAETLPRAFQSFRALPLAVARCMIAFA